MLKWLTDYDLTLQRFFQSFQAEIGVVFLLYSVCVKQRQGKYSFVATNETILMPIFP